MTAPEITGSPRGSFAWDVLHRRHPALIEQVRAGLPYPPERRDALSALAGELTGTIAPIDDWWDDVHFGQSWDDVPFLWAESYFYRRLLDAVGYFGPGPWRGIDPFEPAKTAELAATERPAAGDLATLTDAALWGNRADLGFRLHGSLGRADTHLVVDQRAELWERLPEARTVCVVADNAGGELLADLLLIDHLLAVGTDTVTLHVKPHPYYVSDATVADVIATLRRLDDTALARAVGDGRLVITAPEFYCAPWSFHRMPEDLAEEFAAASLTLVKGDLNYRRLVGDRAWPATTPFEEVTAYFPGPVATLRTLKCDVVTGVAPDTLTALDAAGPWRTTGTHALVQIRH